TPDSTRIAACGANPNQITLWRISDGVVLMNFVGTAAEEGVGAIRFTPDGAHLITTGYLPFVDGEGLWQQKGVIRFWRLIDGTLRQIPNEGFRLVVCCGHQYGDDDVFLCFTDPSTPS